MMPTLGFISLLFGFTFTSAYKWPHWYGHKFHTAHYPQVFHSTPVNPQEQPVYHPVPVSPQQQPVYQPVFINPQQQPVYHPAPVSPQQQPDYNLAPVNPQQQPDYNRAPVNPHQQPYYNRAPVNPHQQPDYNRAPVNPHQQPYYNRAPVNPHQQPDYNRAPVNPHQQPDYNRAPVSPHQQPDYNPAHVSPENRRDYIPVDPVDPVVMTCSCQLYAERELVFQRLNTTWYSCTEWGLYYCGEYCDNLLADETVRNQSRQNACDTLGREINTPWYRRHQVCGEYGPYEDYQMREDLCCRRGRPVDNCEPDQAIGSDQAAGSEETF